MEKLSFALETPYPCYDFRHLLLPFFEPIMQSLNCNIVLSFLPTEIFKQREFEYFIQAYDDWCQFADPT